MLTQDQQKALDMVLGDPALIGVVKAALGAQEQSKMADGVGVVRKQASANAAPITPVGEGVVFKAAGQYDAHPLPQQQFGFGQVQQKSADDGTEAAAAAAVQANLDVAAQAVSTAQAAVDAMATAEVVEPVVEAAPVEMAAEAKATDGNKPAEDAAPAPAKPGGLSDEDMRGIARYVQETVKAAMDQIKADMMNEVKSMYGEMQKMEKTFSSQTQAKLMNEVPATVYQRLKAFGVSGAVAAEAGIKKGADGYVDQGKNLPAAPGAAADLMAKLGFGG